MEICPECNSNSPLVEDHKNGNLVCMTCGYCPKLILVDPGEEKRKFNDGNGDNPHRATKVDEYSETMINHVNADGETEFRKSASVDKTKKAEKTIKRICKEININEETKMQVIEKYKEYAKKLRKEEKNIAPKKERLESQILALISLTTKERGAHRNPKELCQKFNVREVDIKKHLHEFKWLFANSKAHVEIKTLIERAANSLNLEYQTTTRQCLEIADNVKEILEGKHPNSVVAATIAFVTQHQKIAKSHDEIARCSNIKPNTLRTALKEVEKHSAELIQKIEEFRSD